MAINVGDVFNRLTVKELEMRKKNRYAYVQCECGNSKWLLARYVYRGDAKSCGCLRRDFIGRLNRLKPYKDIAQSYFNSFKRMAGKTNREFTMTIEDVWNVWEKQGFVCALTGEKIQFSQHRNDCTATASIDRIDSSKGYTKDNIQIVHKDINRLKNNYDQDYLIEMCTKIVNWKNKNSNQ